MSTPSALIVKYSCACGLDKVNCAVRFRVDGEDVHSWINELAHTVALDHKRRSPQCTEVKMKEVLIPLGVESKRPLGSAE